MLNNMANEIERKSIINDILIPSLERLYKKDYFNIRIGVSERNICARLAHHMETIMHGRDNFRDYFADVEYNRKNDGTIKHSKGYKKVSLLMVSDLIVHKRNVDNNLLAVEMKRWNNYDKRKEDRDRLKSIVSSPEEGKDDCVYDTTLGAFIIYSEEKVLVEFYGKMSGEGDWIGEIEFICRSEGNRCLSLEIIRENWI